MKISKRVIRVVLLTPFHRVTIMVLIILQYILFGYTNLMLIHQSTPLSFFSYKSLATATSTQTHYFWNISLYLLFWAQHIIMASLFYKTKWSAIWPSFALYDRYIYNISSGVALYIMFSLIQPSNIHVFTIPTWICIPFVLYGLAIYVKSLIEVGQGIMMPFKINQILNNKEIQLPSYREPSSAPLKTDGIYGLLRHPMQGGLLCLLIFGNGVYTTERLIFSGLFSVCVLIGVLMQESRLVLVFSDYQKYMKKVKARFIPYVV